MCLCTHTRYHRRHHGGCQIAEWISALSWAKRQQCDEIRNWKSVAPPRSADAMSGTEHTQRMDVCSGPRRGSVVLFPQPPHGLSTHAKLGHASMDAR